MRGQETNGMCYLQATSLPPELQPVGDEDISQCLLAGFISVIQRNAADGAEAWLSFRPQEPTKHIASPLQLAKVLPTVEFPAYQALDRCCVEPTPLSRVLNR